MAMIVARSRNFSRSSLGLKHNFHNKVFRVSKPFMDFPKHNIFSFRIRDSNS